MRKLLWLLLLLLPTIVHAAPPNIDALSVIHHVFASPQSSMSGPNTIIFQNAGVGLGSFGTVNCSTNITCTNNGGVLTITGSAGGGTALSAITAATGPNTIASGNNPQTWNWAQTTDAQDAFAFGETSAATGGTLTNGLANQAELALSTATNSTATPFEVTQGSITNTVATPAMQVETTWNNAGLSGQGLVFNVVDTSSASGSMLFNFQDTGNLILELRKDATLIGGNGAQDFNIAANANNLNLSTQSANKFVIAKTAFSYIGHQAVASSATPNFNISTGNLFTNTLTANVTGATVSQTQDSTFDMFELCQDGTGGRSFVWPTQMIDPPLVQTKASLCRTFPFIYDGTNFFYLGGPSYTAVHQTAQTALIGASTLCAAANCGAAAQYHVHISVWGGGTACGTPSPGGVTPSLTWTDGNGTTHSAVVIPMQSQTTATAVSLASTAPTVPFESALANEGGSGDFNISTNGTIIQYAVAYAACGVGTGTYNLDISIEKVPQ